LVGNAGLQAMNGPADQEGSLPGTRRSVHALFTRPLALIIVMSLFVLSLSSAAEAVTTPGIKKAQSQAEALLALINKLDDELSAATEDYDYAQAQLDATQAKVEKASANITKAQTDLATIQGQLDQRLVNIYKAGKLSMLNVILGASSFSDLITRVDQYERVGKQDSQLLDQIKSYKQTVSDRQAELKTDLQQQTNDAAAAENAKKKVLAQLQRQQKALKGKE
jgi:peptidoglycan hydrolase CwlO-like protein